MIGYVSVMAVSIIELLYFAEVEDAVDLIVEYFPYPVRSGWAVYSAACFTYSFFVSVQAFSGLTIQKFMKREMEGGGFARILLIVVEILGLLIPGIILWGMFKGGILSTIVAFAGVAIAYSVVAKPVPTTYYPSNSKLSSEEELEDEVDSMDEVKRNES